MVKVLRIVGLVWCYAVAAIIVACIVVIARRDGLGAAIDVLSPFNVANFIVTVVSLAPGLLCLWGADRMQQRRRTARRP